MINYRLITMTEVEPKPVHRDYLIQCKSIHIANRQAAITGIVSKMLTVLGRHDRFEIAVIVDISTKPLKSTSKKHLNRWKQTMHTLVGITNLWLQVYPHCFKSPSRATSQEESCVAPYGFRRGPWGELQLTSSWFRQRWSVLLCPAWLNFFVSICNLIIVLVTLN